MHRARGADFGDTLGFNVRGGYRLNEDWAFEGLYEYGDDFGAHQVAPGADIQTNTFMDGSTGLSRRGNTVFRGVGLGGFAEYVVVSASGAVDPPSSVSAAGASLRGRICSRHGRVRACATA